MIDELKADGYSVAEIVNFLLLGAVLDPKPSKLPTPQQQSVPYREDNKKLLYDTLAKPYQRGKSRTFSPTTEDIERGITLFRQTKDAQKFQSN